MVSDLGLWEGTLEDAEDYAGIRLEIQMGKWEYLYGLGNAEEEREKKAEYLKRNREMEEELDCYAGVRGMSKETAWILGGADPKTDCNTDQKGERKTEETAKLRRMDNYAFLDQRLRGNTQFVPVLDYAEGAYHALHHDCTAGEANGRACPLFYGGRIRCGTFGTGGDGACLSPYAVGPDGRGNPAVA